MDTTGFAISMRRLDGDSVMLLKAVLAVFGPAVAILAMVIAVMEFVYL